MGICLIKAGDKLRANGKCEATFGGKLLQHKHKSGDLGCYNWQNSPQSDNQSIFYSPARPSIKSLVLSSRLEIHTGAERPKSLEVEVAGAPACQRPGRADREGYQASQCHNAVLAVVAEPVRTLSGPEYGSAFGFLSACLSSPTAVRKLVVRRLAGLTWNRATPIRFKISRASQSARSGLAVVSA